MSKHIVFDCDGTLLDSSNYNYSLYPGVKELIKDLTQDCLLYVWTARDRASTIRFLEDNGVYRYFEAICTVDDALPKPHSEGIRSLVGTAEKSSVCVIGDTSNDIVGAKKFGVMSIGAAWSPEARVESLKSSGADFIVSDPAECSKLVRQNLKESSDV